MGALLLSLALLGSAWAQQAGTFIPEVHPSLTWQRCTKSTGCITQSTGKIVLDSDWRWLHGISTDRDCYIANAWDPVLCPDPATCADNCALEGADYSGTYGITTSGNALTLKFVTKSGSTTNLGSRVYLLSGDTAYQTFKLKNQEFTFDVNATGLPCSLNGALFFTQMDGDGGMAKFSGNRAGAKYGTGFCDAQCPKGLKFINGEANLLHWAAAPTVPNGGAGQYGSCCTEMDVWEANSISAAYTPHSCALSSQTRCEDADCSAGFCDPDGCDFNSYRLGDKTFYGKGLTIDTTQKITVITQFITTDGTATGSLSEIRRLYVQNGKVIQNSKTQIPGMAVYDSISESFCDAQKTAFGEKNIFADKGGFQSVEEAFEKGMVLAMSISHDPVADFLWLDGNYPIGADPSQPGVARGTCSPYVIGLPIEDLYPTASVTFSNIRFGDIGSTY